MTFCCQLVVACRCESGPGRRYDRARNNLDRHTNYWEVEHLWEDEHHLEIAVAQLAPDGSVDTCSERLSFWPFRYEELVAELQSVGLGVGASTFNPEAEE